MAINFDWVWSQEPNGRSRVRQVYCHDKPIGLPGELMGILDGGEPPADRGRSSAGFRLRY